MTPQQNQNNRPKTAEEEQRVSTSDEAQAKYFREHPEEILAPHGDSTRLARAVLGVELLRQRMDEILAGHQSVGGQVDGAPAQLHSPSSPKGNGRYYLKTLELAATVKDGEWDAWVPLGFGMIGLDDVNEKLDAFEKSDVRPL